MMARFMCDIPYAETERAMQQIPRFHPKGTGMIISPFATRMTHLFARIHPCFFIARYWEQFEFLWNRHTRIADQYAMCATLYLLSADCFLWGKAISAIQLDIIRFANIHIHGVNLNGYVLLQP